MHFSSKSSPNQTSAQSFTDGIFLEIKARDGEESLPKEQQEESLLDLIAGYGQQAEKSGSAAGKKEEKKSSGKGTGGQK